MATARGTLPALRTPEPAARAGALRAPPAPRGLRLRLSRSALNWVLYLMFAPLALYAVIFWYVPIAGLVVAFKEYNYQQGIFGSPWNGWENFRFFYESGK